MAAFELEHYDILVRILFQCATVSQTFPQTGLSYILEGVLSDEIITLYNCSQVCRVLSVTCYESLNCNIPSSQIRTQHQSECTQSYQQMTNSDEI